MQQLSDTPPKHLLCFSHLRWDFVLQRPQHLLKRCAKDMQVYFFEEPLFDTDTEPFFSIAKREEHLHIVIPHLNPGLTSEQIVIKLSSLVDKFLEDADLSDWIFWYYTPMALPFTDRFSPKLVIYDCMDELSGFKFAPKELVAYENRLFAKANLVFTGGYSLYEAKKSQHPMIFPFPSSIDKEHFAKARKLRKADPNETVKIGFYGVIDERFDIELIKNIADLQPNWIIELVGPIVKINSSDLPKNTNIKYLGQQSYQDLPNFLCEWDVALIPFLLNEATKFISPTKTPEYLAAGVPVVSTPIADVVNPYGHQNLVHIAKNHIEFIEAITLELNRKDREAWLVTIDNFLKDLSWDFTYAKMKKLIEGQIKTDKKLEIANNISIAS
jgi:glycosyltransferase involved in cell wall biosynthesis